MENKKLQQSVINLAVRRQMYEQKKSELDALRAAFDQEHDELIAEVSAYSMALKDAEETCRDVAMLHYHETDEKKPLDGVEIKLWDTATFDAADALLWCRVNMPALLMLNAKSYEKVLRERANSKALRDALPDMPGNVAEEPKTSLARDLSQYIPKGEDESDGNSD